MDDDDDLVMVTPSSNFTSIKERNETENEMTQASNFKRTVEPNISQTNKNKCKISFELLDSDSELTDVSKSCRNTLERLKSSILNLEASSSKTFTDGACVVQSVPSSPDSDSELLKPVFDYEHSQSSGNKSSAKVSNSRNLSESVIDKGKDVSMGHSGVLNSVASVREFKGSLESIGEDACLEELPVKKKKRTKEEVEERKREALVGWVFVLMQY